MFYTWRDEYNEDSEPFVKGLLRLHSIFDDIELIVGENTTGAQTHTKWFYFEHTDIGENLNYVWNSFGENIQKAIITAARDPEKKLPGGASRGLLRFAELAIDNKLTRRGEMLWLATSCWIPTGQRYCQALPHAIGNSVWIPWNLYVGDQLKTARESNNMTIEYVAYRLGLTSTDLYRWESGVCAPPVIFRKLAELYKKNPTDLDPSLHVWLRYSEKCDKLRSK